MKLVIELNDRVYKSIVGTKDISDRQKYLIINALCNGVPLPKHHGRLIDADKLIEEMEKDVRRAMSFVDLTDLVWLSLTIIEADKESEGKE